tara:strand:+ start:15384 stop:16058 length:675 start_codon:yes stop_codon:yes gene_type:complete
MSRTNPVEETTSVQNPTTAFIEWNAQNGQFKMWDNINKQVSFLEKPMRFAVLDQMSSVEGWLGDRGTAYSTGFRQSNEDISVYVRKDGSQTLHKRGTYSDIKDELKDEGITYRKNIYAMLCEDIDDVPIGSIVCIKLKGKSANLWIEGKYGDNSDLTNSSVQTIGRFKYPVWESIELSKDEIENAKDCDKELQEYFNSLNHNATSHQDESVEAIKDDMAEEIPF